MPLHKVLLSRLFAVNLSAASKSGVETLKGFSDMELIPLLIEATRAMRNVVADNKENQNALVDNEIHSDIACLFKKVEAVLAGSDKWNKEVLKLLYVSVQLLCNIIVGNRMAMNKLHGVESVVLQYGIKSGDCKLVRACMMLVNYCMEEVSLESNVIDLIVLGTECCSDDEDESEAVSQVASWVIGKVVDTGKSEFLC